MFDVILNLSKKSAISMDKKFNVSPDLLHVQNLVVKLAVHYISPSALEKYWKSIHVQPIQIFFTNTRSEVFWPLCVQYGIF